MAEAEEILRRRTDELFTTQLAKCEHGIAGVAKSINELRESVHTQVGTLAIQIAKIPVPMSLVEMEERFTTRRESEISAAVIGKLLDTFITKEEVRPIKVALYTLWGAIGLSMITIAYTLASKN